MDEVFGISKDMERAKALFEMVGERVEMIISSMNITVEVNGDVNVG